MEFSIEPVKRLAKFAWEKDNRELTVFISGLVIVAIIIFVRAVS